MDGHHWGTGWSMGWGTWLLFLLICLSIYFIFKNKAPAPGGTRGESAMDILRKRYARGEITKEQFDAMSKDVSQR